MLPHIYPAGGGTDPVTGFRECALTKLATLMIVLGTAAVPVAPASAQIAGAGLHFNAIGTVLYDSNQLRSTAARIGNGTGSVRSPDDVRYSPALSASYGRDTGRLSLAVNGLVGYDFYQNNSYLNRNRFRAGGTLGYSPGGRCSAQLNGSYVNRQNGTGDPGVDPLPTDQPPDDVGFLIDNGQVFTTYGINANCGSPGGRLSFGGSATRSNLSNNAPTRRFANSESENYAANIGIGVFRPGQLSLNGSYSTITYPNRQLIPGFVGGNNSGVQTYRVGLAYTRPLGTKLTGTIGAAYLTARPRGGQSPYTSPAYNASLTYLPSPRLTIGLAASRDIIASQTAGALFRVVDNVNLNAGYKVGSALTTRASVGILRSDYRQSFGTPDQPLARGNELSKIFSVGAVYSPRPLYDVSVSVLQTIRTSTPSIYSFNSTRVSATLAIHI